MDLSIVASLYESAPTLLEFYERVKRQADRLTDAYEIVLVHDGSPDDSLGLALSLYRRDPRVRVVDLSRNFGEHRAMMTGLRYSRGDLVFLTDCDLEEEPELLGEFAARLEESGADVVYGVQRTRKGGWFERLSGGLFFRLFNLLSEVQLPVNTVTTRLMRREYVNSLIEHDERETILGGLFVLTGYRQVPAPIVKSSESRSTYNFGRKLTHLVNSITSFSDKPLVFIFYLGVAIVLVSGVYAAWLIIRKIFFGIAAAGWASLIVSVWLLGGLTIFCLGVIGIYLSRVFVETKKRPYAVVRAIYETSNAEGSLSTGRELTAMSEQSGTR